MTQHPDTIPDFAALQPVHINNNNHTSAKPFAVDACELLGESDAAAPFLLDGLLHKTGLACLAGVQNAGKSSLLRQLAIAVAVGDESFLDWKLNTVHRSAIYVATENGREATRHVLRRQAGDLPKEKLKGLRFVFDDHHLLANLDAELAERPADLVVIDCFRDAYGGDLRESQRIRSFLHRFQLLAERHQCLLIFVHQTDADSEFFEPGTDKLLYGPGFGGKMRTVLELRTDVMNYDRPHLCVLKGELPDDTKDESYVLEYDDSTFTCTSTGNRSPFTLLVQKQNRGFPIDARDKFYEAYKLKKEGLSYQQIAEEMGYSSKSSIAEIFKRAREEEWNSRYADYDDTDAGEDGEEPVEAR